MKKLIYSMMIGAATLLAACDEVKPEERLTYVKPATVARAVLVEDFTGQRCVNCPTAHEVIEQLQEEYGDAVVAVSIHGGALAMRSTATLLGLTTDEGEAYNTEWGCEAWPVGLVDRRGGLQNYDRWTASVMSELEKSAPADLKVYCDYQPTWRRLTITVDATGYEALSGKLQLWAVEDGIVALQMMPDGSRNREYVHNNVLRKALNGTWGTDIQLAEGRTVSTTLTVDVPDEWQAENVSVVAFVYNADGVQQVTRQRITSAGKTE